MLIIPYVLIEKRQVKANLASRDKSKSKKNRARWAYTFFGIVLIFAYGVGFGRWVYLDINQTSNPSSQNNNSRSDELIKEN